MQVIFDEEQRPEDSLSALFTKAAELAFSHESIDSEGCEVSLSFADPEGMRALNAQYRDKNSPTDVLSFPMYESAAEMRKASAPILIGDVVICREIAERQAKEYGHSMERELIYLFIHSMFHLLGYNHEEAPGSDPEDASAQGKRAMRAAEENVLRKLKIER